METIVTAYPTQLAIACVAALAATVGGIEADAQSEADTNPSQPHIFIILFDSLRADYTEPYGSETVRTPHFATFAAQGVTFLNARSNSPWTRPSVASLLTSRYPHEHGVSTATDSVPEDLPMLQENLQENGYRTLLVTTSPQTYPEWGFGRGFDETAAISPFWWDLKDEPSPEKRADRMWSEQVAPLLGATEEVPHFVFLHELDPHHPYDPPPPYDQMYPAEPRPKIKVGSKEWRTKVEQGEITLTDADLRYMKSQYAGKVTFIDAYFQRLLGFIESRLGPDTLVILTSDHGEEFMEHGQITHGKALYEESVRVPLIMRHPRLIEKGAAVEPNVQLLDLAPTLLNLVGASPPEAMRGRDLFSAMAREQGEQTTVRALHRTFMSHSLGYVPYRESGMVWGNLKLIRRRPLDATGDRSQYLLFHLGDDSLEQHDLSIAELMTAGVLKRQLEEEIPVMRSPDPQNGETMNEFERFQDQIESLGYLRDE